MTLDDGVRRDNPRRAARLGAVALAAVIAVPTAFAGGCTSRNDPPDASAKGSPPASAVAAGDASQGTSTATQWAKPSLELPVFPFTPSWEPPGIGPRHVGRQGPNVDVTYETSRSVLSVEIGPVAADWDAEPDEEHASTVGDRPATVRTAKEFDGAEPGDRYVGIRWQLPDKQWVQVLSFGPRTEQEVLRFARELRPQPLPGSPLPFTVATAPPGLVLQQLNDTDMCLAPPAAMRDRNQRGICVGVLAAAPEGENPDGERLTVGGRPATLVAGEANQPVGVEVQLEEKRMLSITLEADDVTLTRDELVRFAEGITVNPS